MRKSLLKSIVAAAVVGATMAITSVAAMAATTISSTVKVEKTNAETNVYVDEVTSLTYNNAFKIDKFDKLTSSSPKTVIGNYLYFKVDKTAKLTVSGKTKRAIYLVPEAADLASLTGLTNADDEFTAFKDTYVVDANKKVAEVGTDTEFENVDFGTLAPGGYYIFLTSGNGYIYDLTFTVEGDDTGITAGVFDNAARTGKVVVVAGEATTAPSVYVVAVVSKDDLAKGDTLTVKFNDQNKTTVETDTVYPSVDGVDTANFGGDYYYAVNVTGVSSDADVDALKAFTFDIA